MASNRIKGITIEIGGDTTDLQKALKNVNKQIRDTQSSLRDVEKLLKLDPKNTELLRQKQKLLGDQIKLTEDKLKTEKEALAQLAKQDSTPEVARQQDALQREIIETEQRLQSLRTEAGKTGDTMKAAFEDAGSKISAVGEKVTDTGKTLTKNVTAPIMAVGAASVVAFKELDEGMDIVTTKTGALGDDLEDLKQIAENLFTSMNVTAEEAGTAVGEVNTRFKVTGDELENVSRSFLEFARINGVDVNSAIDDTDALMKKFSIDISHVDEVLGLLTKAGQDTGISMSTLESSLKTNGATLQELGLGLEESVNLLASMEANGVDASTALMGLKKSVVTAAKDGKSANQALNETVEAIKNAKTETEALQIAQETFGTRGAVEMTNAIRSGRFSLDDLNASMSQYKNTVEDTYGATQDATDEAAIALNNLKSVGAELAAAGFDAFGPVLKEIVAGLKEFAEWFKNLDDGTKETLVKVLAIVAALGPLLVALGSVISAVGSIVSALGTLGPILAHIGQVIVAIAGTLGGLVVAAIGLVIAAIAVWIKNWEYIKQLPSGIAFMVGQAFTFIKEKVLEAATFLKTKFVEGFIAVMTTISELKEKIRAKFDEIIQKAKTWGADLIQNLINGIKSKIGEVGSAAKSIADKIAGYIHFSLPEEGPLADTDTFMPDMLKELSAGIKANLNLLDNPMDKLATALVPQTQNVNVNYDQQFGGQLTALGDAISGMQNTTQVVIEGDMAGLFKAMRKENGQFKRANAKSAF